MLFGPLILTVIMLRLFLIFSFSVHDKEASVVVTGESEEVGHASLYVTNFHVWPALGAIHFPTSVLYCHNQPCARNV